MTLRITYIPVSKKPVEIQQAGILYGLRWVTLRQPILRFYSLDFSPSNQRPFKSVCMVAHSVRLLHLYTEILPIFTVGYASLTHPPILFIRLFTI